MKTKEKSLALGVGVLAVLSVFLVWYFAASYTKVSLFFPTPQRVFQRFVESLTVPIGKYTLLIHVLYSLKRVFIGFGLSSITGIILGVAMGYSKTVNAIVRPIFNIIRPIPGLAWIPLAILWFGIGETTKYFIIFMGGFANIVLNSFDGTNKVNPTLVGAAELLGANKFQIFTNIILPSAIPYIFAGLQVSLSTSWMAVLAAEMISSYEGARMDHQYGNEHRGYSPHSGRYDFHCYHWICPGKYYESFRKEIVFMDGKGKITVRCKDLCKTFYAKNRKQDEENEVIRNLNLEVRENEFLVLFGPGQCGKTTILNLMAGLVEPTSGEIEVNGKKVDGPSKDRGMVYQTTALFPLDERDEKCVLRTENAGSQEGGMEEKGTVLY